MSKNDKKCENIQNKILYFGSIIQTCSLPKYFLDYLEKHGYKPGP